MITERAVLLETPPVNFNTLLEEMSTNLLDPYPKIGHLDEENRAKIVRDAEKYGRQLREDWTLGIEMVRARIIHLRARVDAGEEAHSVWSEHNFQYGNENFTIYGDPLKVPVMKVSFGRTANPMSPGNAAYWSAHVTAHFEKEEEGKAKVKDFEIKSNPRGDILYTVFVSDWGVERFTRKSMTYPSKAQLWHPQRSETQTVEIPPFSYQQYEREDL